MLNHETHEINKITLRRIYSLKTRFRFFRDFRGKNI